MCHVLIIEDECVISEYLAYLVEEAGATSIATAATEDDAVKAAHDHMPGIILSDVKLLAGTGPDAVQTIMEQLGSVPVIFITGTPDICHPRSSESIVLQKPVDAARLIATFSRLAPGPLVARH